MDKKLLSKVIVVAIIVTGVLLAVQTAIGMITPEQIPDYIEPVWSYVVIFFTATPVIAVLAFCRNILGYARNYWQTEHKEEYDINRLYATWMYYIGGIATVLTAVPKPYDSVAVAIIVLLDFVTSEIKKMQTP